MKIHEFIGKKILKEYGINVPESVFIKNFPPEKGIIPSVIKSQVLVGGRMKAGGVLFADNGEEFLRNTEILLKKPIKGEFPYGVLAEEKIKIKHEYYISAVLNREKRSEEWIFSEEGGIEIENSENIKKGSYEEILNTVPEKFRTFLPKLKKIFNEKDLTLLEINPVAEDISGNLTALDCVMHVDDNALFRQPWAKKFAEDDRDFHYVELDGNIGIIGCGAGIVMATMDAVKNAGYSPANFLDIGGGYDASCRNFAPHLGIKEETATGTASGALAAYIIKNKIYNGKFSFTFEQGYAMKKPSVIKAVIQYNKNFERIQVGGRAFSESETEI